MAHLESKPGVTCWGSGMCDIGAGISVKDIPSTFCVAGPENGKFRVSLRLVGVVGGRYMVNGTLRSATQRISMSDLNALSPQMLAFSRDRLEERGG